MGVTTEERVECVFMGMGQRWTVRRTTMSESFVHSFTIYRQTRQFKERWIFRKGLRSPESTLQTLGVSVQNQETEGFYKEE